MTPLIQPDMSQRAKLAEWDVLSRIRKKRDAEKDSERLDWLMDTLIAGGVLGLRAALGENDDGERVALDRSAIDAAMGKNPSQELGSARIETWPRAEN